MIVAWACRVARRPALVLAAVLGGVAGACEGGDGWNERGPPVMTLLSPKALDSVAYRDGDGPWQALDNAFGVYRFEIHQERFSLAFLCREISLGEVIHA